MWSFTPIFGVSSVISTGKYINWISGRLNILTKMCQITVVLQGLELSCQNIHSFSMVTLTMRFIHNGNLRDMSFQIVKFSTLVWNHFLIGKSVRYCDQKGHTSITTVIYFSWWSCFINVSHNSKYVCPCHWR